MWAGRKGGSEGSAYRTVCFACADSVDEVLMIWLFGGGGGDLAADRRSFASDSSLEDERN